MILNKITRTIKRQLLDMIGWHTSRKIVVIESDDWGSIRMPSKEVYHQLLKKGIKVDRCPYAKYDSLANEQDLSFLFETLNSVRDHRDSPARLTANTIVANPDFARIRAANFERYFYEPFTETLKRYPNHTMSFKLWKQGMEAGIFHPQFHGREHVNVDFWLQGLSSGLPETRAAFDHAVFGISSSITSETRKNYMFALDYNTVEEKEHKEAVLEAGADLFKTIFGYFSESFIAPAYTWSDSNEQTLRKKGIKTFQGNPYQNRPQIGNNVHEKLMHYIGEKNKNGQTYLVRNAYFEPTLMKREAAKDDCLKRINWAFKMKKPAIIGAHRVNFIGNIENSNRDKNLKSFHSLLNTIVKKWPDVEFMTSDELGNLINR